MKLPTLHLYGQLTNHESAFIVGDRDSLERLKKAIDLALEDRVATGTFEASDGEGYDVFVVRSDADEMKNLMFPYQDEIFHDPGVLVGKKPIVGWLIPVETYRRLYKSDDEVTS